MTLISYASAPDIPAVKGRGFISRYLREMSVAAAYAALLLTLFFIRPAFFQSHAGSQSQFGLTWVSAAPILVAAVGMTLVIISRHIDISIGSQFSVCGIIAGSLAVRHVPAPGIIVGTLAAGAIMGAINGGLVAGMGLPSIVVTLATMVILRGALTWITQGATVLLPASFQWFGASQRVGQGLMIGIALVIFAAFAWALRWLRAGRAVYAVGSDQEAARLAGVRPGRVVFAVFVIMGVLTGAAALLNAMQFITIYPSAGKDLELAVIAAVVVGGAAITGGRGTLLGTLLGVALLATIGPALGYFHAQSKWAGPEWAKAIQGLIILFAVASDGLSKGRRNE
ncbi:MAG TPA: ABC transporter permease [Tepidisphaeraceae bacterium]|jgi:rhamnose transport system permease protein|nr:ABC transporter permease [Tepidisphaeraceae bacterium]